MTESQPVINTNEELNEKSRLYDKLGQFVAIPMSLLKQGCYLTPQAKWVYVTLRSFTNNDTDRTFPSYKKIQERSGLSRPTIAKALRELEHFYWIEKKRNFSRSTDYFLADPTHWLSESEGVKAEELTIPTKDDAIRWRKATRQREWEFNVKGKHPTDFNLNGENDQFLDDGEDIPF